MSRTVRQHGYGPIGLHMEHSLISHLLQQTFQTEARGKLRAVGCKISAVKPFRRVIRKVVAELEVRLTRDGTSPQESTDGKRVFYVAGSEQDELWSVSVNGGDEHREEGIPKFVNDLSWTPAENGIFFDGPPSHLSIKYFNFSDRRTENISALRGISFVCCSINVSRDNGTLLFSAVDRLESDIMLVENFH